MKPDTPLVLADEEADSETFRAYLAALSPEELWDVRGHLDRDQYPRRREMVEREIARRGLLFLTPYTRTELALRSVVSACLCVAILAAVVRGLPALAGGVSRVARSLGARSTDSLGQPVAVSFAFSDRELALLAVLLRGLRPLSMLASVIAVTGTVSALLRFTRRKVRADLLATLLAFTGLTLLFTWLAFRS